MRSIMASSRATSGHAGQHACHPLLSPGLHGIRPSTFTHRLYSTHVQPFSTQLAPSHRSAHHAYSSSSSSPSSSSNLEACKPAIPKAPAVVAVALAIALHAMLQLSSPMEASARTQLTPDEQVTIEMYKRAMPSGVDVASNFRVITEAKDAKLDMGGLLRPVIGQLASSASALPSAEARSFCDAESFSKYTPQQRAVACYTGNFMVKMLTELNAGDMKTVEHVRTFLNPYMGGVPALESDTNISKGGREGLLGLRNRLSAEQLKDYDQLGVCYVTLTNRIMEKLPQDDQGNLSPTTTKGHDTFKQVDQLFENLFESKEYDAGSCRRA